MFPLKENVPIDIRLLCFPDVNWLNRFETQYCKYTEKGRVREYMRSKDLQSIQYSIFKIKIDGVFLDLRPSDLLARGFTAARWTSGRSDRPPSLS